MTAYLAEVVSTGYEETGTPDNVEVAKKIEVAPELGEVALAPKRPRPTVDPVDELTALSYRRMSGYGSVAAYQDSPY